MYKDDEYEKEELEGFHFEDDETPLYEIPINEMTDEQLEIWLDFQPFYYRWLKYVGIAWGHLDNIRHIVYNFIWVMLYKFLRTSFYRHIHIGTMIVCASVYWTIMFGQEDIKIMDGKDETKIIFHLPSI